MESNKSTKRGLIVISIILLASLIFLGSIYNANSGLKEKLNGEKLKHDSILSTKILLDKEILGLTSELNREKGKNHKLDSVIEAISLELAGKTKTIAQLRKENGNVKSLRKELKQLKMIRDGLKRQLDEMSNENKSLSTENKGLKNRIQSLEQELADAKKPIEKGYSAQNFRIELQKKNTDKLTVKANKTKNIQLYFDLVGEVGGEQTIYVKITDPDGYIVAPYITPVMIKGEKITYTKSQIVKLDGTVKKTVIDIKPTKKLKSKGVYKVMVYNEKEGLIGSSEVMTN